MIHFLRAGLLAFLLSGCGASVNVTDFEERDSAVPADTSTSGDTIATDTTPVGGAGELGAPCTKDGECKSGFCLDIGRCSRACKAAGACPNSPNWTCLVVPGRGPMCECDVLNKTDVMCNGVDDNCDGVIDEGSPPKCCPADKPTLCGMTCVDTKNDPGHCGSCGKPCPDGSTCVAGSCSKSVPVDVNILLDVSGSTQPSLDKAVSALTSKLALPLVGGGDVLVGVSYSSDYPINPYGSSGDRAFTGGIEPTTTESLITNAITAYPKAAGGDASDGMIEGIAVLAGATPHPTSLALKCSAGRIAGGCWRAEARKVIVLFTDDVFHNGPHPTSSGLYDAYTGITPEPVDWPAARKAMGAQGVWLFIISTVSEGSTPDATPQHKKILADLGQPATDIYFAGTGSENIDKAASAVLARIKALK